MPSRQSGQALIASIVGLSLVMLVLLAALSITQFSGQLLARQLTYQGQAINAAQAGLIDVQSWFRRQTTQPVPTFAPVLDPGGVCTHIPPHVPPKNDTEDPAIGIVRTYSVSDPGRLKGRYEVRIGNTATGTGVLDVTIPRGKAGNGTVWQLESNGFIYVDNGSATWNASPNVVLSRETVRTEIQRLNLVLPDAGAAIFARRGDGVNIGANSKVQGGGGIGLDYPSSTGTHTAGAGAVITGGGGATKTNSSASFRIIDVFGVSQQELLNMADVNVTQVSDLPIPLPGMSLIVINGDANFTVAAPLAGSGVLVVLGNVTIPANSNSTWSGVVYLTGNLTMAQPSAITGAVIAAGNGDPTTAGTGGGVTLVSASDISEIDFDGAIITQIDLQMGFYRQSRGVFIVGKDN